MSNSIVYFLNILSSNSLPVFSWHLRYLIRNNIINDLNPLRLYLVGTFPKNFILPSCVDIVYTASSAPNNHNESTALKFFQQYSHSYLEKSDYITYLHAKGSSHPSLNRSTILWTLMMLRGLSYINKHVLNDSNLSKSFDTFGSFLTSSKFGWKLSYTSSHYQGNFWTATSQYFFQLDPSLLDSNDRYAAEYWIGAGLPRMYNFFSSTITTPYELELKPFSRKVIDYISKSNFGFVDDCSRSYPFLLTLLPQSVNHQIGITDFHHSPTWLNNFNFPKFFSSLQCN